MNVGVRDIHSSSQQQSLAEHKRSHVAQRVAAQLRCDISLPGMIVKLDTTVTGMCW